MGKYTGSPWGEIRGKLGDSVGQKNKGRKYVRSRPLPRFKNTHKQRCYGDMMRLLHEIDKKLNIMWLNQAAEEMNRSTFNVLLRLNHTILRESCPDRLSIENLQYFPESYMLTPLWDVEPSGIDFWETDTYKHAYFIFDGDYLSEEKPPGRRLIWMTTYGKDEKYTLIESILWRMDTYDPTSYGIHSKVDKKYSETWYILLQIHDPLTPAEEGIHRDITFTIIGEEWTPRGVWAIHKAWS